MIPFILSKEESKLSCAVSHENVCKLAADQQIPNTAACMHDMCLFLMETLKIRLTLTRTEFPHSFMIVTFGVICAAGESLSTLFLFTAKRKQLCQNLGMENVMSEKLQPPHSILNKWKVCASSPRDQGYLCDTHSWARGGVWQTYPRSLYFTAVGPRQKLPSTQNTDG